MREPRHDQYGLLLASKHARFTTHKSRRHPDWWWYEERGGIAVVNADAGQCWIPVAQLRAYLKRHDGEEESDG